MEKGYRIPKLEEFVKGFKYEWKSPSSGNWITDYVIGDVSESLMKYFKSCINREVVRVKS